MSNRQHEDDRLYGWNGPFFPEGLSALHEQLDAGHYNANMIDLAAGTFPGYEGHTPVVTHDSEGGQYTWAYAVRFRFGDGSSMLIALPFNTDHYREDDTNRDRSAAVYSDGVTLANMDWLDKTVRVFAVRMGEARAELAEV